MKYLLLFGMMVAACVGLLSDTKTKQPDLASILQIPKIETPQVAKPAAPLPPASVASTTESTQIATKADNAHSIQPPTSEASSAVASSAIEHSSGATITTLPSFMNATPMDFSPTTNSSKSPPVSSSPKLAVLQSESLTTSEMESAQSEPFFDCFSLGQSE
jgi:hypothetical protein